METTSRNVPANMRERDRRPKEWDLQLAAVRVSGEQEPIEFKVTFDDGDHKIWSMPEHDRKPRKQVRGFGVRRSQLNARLLQAPAYKTNPWPLDKHALCVVEVRHRSWRRCWAVHVALHVENWNTGRQLLKTSPERRPIRFVCGVLSDVASDQDHIGVQICDGRKHRSFVAPKFLRLNVGEQDQPSLRPRRRLIDWHDMRGDLQTPRLDPRTPGERDRQRQSEQTRR
jgi:hypothetical protein